MERDTRKSTTRATARKAPARKKAAAAPAPKKTGRKAAGRPAGGGKRTVTPEERWHMIAEAAYFRAEQRGFKGGNAEQDWLEAEAEVDARLLENGTRITD